MKLSFFGAAGEVTGSCFLLETGTTKVLIDCGMFQGTRFAAEQNHAPFPFDAKSISAVLVTHAHLDHTGRLPKLVKAGFNGPIYATKPTTDLALLVLEDAVEVMGYEAGKHHTTPIFDDIDVARTAKQFSGVDYGQPVTIGDQIQAAWHDAGHILGSSFIEITADGKRLVFSGDLGNRDVPIMRTTEALPETDVLVMESTYGGHLHEDPKTRSTLLRDAIIRVIKSRGVLMIPAFAIERIQEILYELSLMVQHDLIPHVPIYLDSPLAIRATEVFRRYRNYYDADAVSRLSMGEDFFEFAGLEKTTTRDRSRMINEIPPPKVIIAGAGMMTGGRIMHHLQRYLPDPASMVLVTGYQPKRTLGRRLLEGETEVEIYGKRVAVRAHIEKLGGYSAHADRDHLLSFVAGAPRPPKRTFLVHGEPESQTTLAHALHDKIKIDPEIPKFGDQFSL